MTYQQIFSSNSNHLPSNEEGGYGNEVKPRRNETSEIIKTVPKYTTKAGTLRFLKDRLKSAAIADLYSFTVSTWKTDREACLSEINKLFFLALLNKQSNSDLLRTAGLSIIKFMFASNNILATSKCMWFGKDI